jgi:hypothetical protein
MNKEERIKDMLDRATEELRMQAYYYGFDRTGVIEIDRILSAVARAGKWAHHTGQWADGDELDDGSSPVEWIQNAANDAAKQWKETH